MSDQPKPRPPTGLSRAGRRQWKQVIDDADSQDIDLDSRELYWLEDAARLADRIDQLEEALAESGDHVVPGHAGQPVAHPLLGEIRQSRMLRAQMLARIRVSAPEEKLTGNVLPLGLQQRDAANKRWRGTA